MRVVVGSSLPNEALLIGPFLLCSFLKHVNWWEIDWTVEALNCLWQVYCCMYRSVRDKWTERMQMIHMLFVQVFPLPIDSFDRPVETLWTILRRDRLFQRHFCRQLNHQFDPLSFRPTIRLPLIFWCIETWVVCFSYWWNRSTCHHRPPALVIKEK